MLDAIEKREAEEGPDPDPEPYWLTKAPNEEAYKEAHRKFEEAENAIP